MVQERQHVLEVVVERVEARGGHARERRLEQPLDRLGRAPQQRLAVGRGAHAHDALVLARAQLAHQVALEQRSHEVAGRGRLDAHAAGEVAHAQLLRIGDLGERPELRAAQARGALERAVVLAQRAHDDAELPEHGKHAHAVAVAQGTVPSRGNSRRAARANSLVRELAVLLAARASGGSHGR